MNPYAKDLGVKEDKKLLARGLVDGCQPIYASRSDGALSQVKHGIKICARHRCDTHCRGFKPCCCAAGPRRRDANPAPPVSWCWRFFSSGGRCCGRRGTPTSMPHSLKPRGYLTDKSITSVSGPGRSLRQVQHGSMCMMVGTHKYGENRRSRQ